MRDDEGMTESGLTPEKVREFQLLMREECRVDLSFEAAWGRAAQLIALYRMLIGPIPEDSGVRTSAHMTSPIVDTRRW